MQLFIFMFLNPSGREFCKRTADDLPFYYWTGDDRYSMDDLPSFNELPQIDDADDVDPSSHPLRLHRLTLNRREDSSIFVAGRSFLPARNQPTIRQRLFRPAELPPSNWKLCRGIICIHVPVYYKSIDLCCSNQLTSFQCILLGCKKVFKGGDNSNKCCLSNAVSKKVITKLENCPFLGDFSQKLQTSGKLHYLGCEIILFSCPKQAFLELSIPCRGSLIDTITWCIFTKEF